MPVKRFSLAAEIALAVFLAWIGASLVWVVLAPVPVGAASAASGFLTAPSKTAASAAPLSFDPFHRQLASGMVAPVERETALDLKLYGVRSGRDASAGSAIIRTPDNRQDVFYVGQRIADGVTLTGVFPDRVTISHRGVLESLSLDDRGGSLRRPAPVQSAAAAQMRRAVRNDTPSAGAADPAPAPRPAVAAQPRNKAGNNGALSAIEGPFGTFLRSIEVRPRMGSGGLNGFTIHPGPDGGQSIFDLVGLKSGDVLVAVGGVRLTTMENLNRINDRLGGVERVEVSVERAGREETFEIELEELR